MSDVALRDNRYLASSGTAQLFVVNTPPAIDLTGGQASVTVDEGQTATNVGTLSDDDGDVLTLSTTAGIVIDKGDGTWSWSLTTNDGPDDSQTATVIVSDGEAQSSVSFDLNVSNVAPLVAAANAMVTVNEGQTANNSGTYSDSGDDIVTLSASAGTVIDNGDGTWSWSLVTTNGPDESQMVTITAMDSDGTFSTTSFQLLVDNVAPTITANNASVMVNEGQTAANSGTFSDLGADTIVLTASVGTVTKNANGTWSWSWGTNSGPAQSQTVTITANDGSAESTVTFSLTVSNVAPVVGPITVSQDLVPVNSSFSAEASFSDAGTGDTHTATWNWGDGTTSAGTITEANGSDTVAGSHVYTATGFYTVTLTVSDGSNPTQTMLQNVLVYEAGVGKVTGGGKINAPGAACVFGQPYCNNNKNSELNYGFDIQYIDGSAVPVGQTTMTYKSGMVFASIDQYELLAVIDDVAFFRGQGTLSANNVPDITAFFEVWVIDSDIHNPGVPDRLGAKIWYVDNNGQEIVFVDTSINNSDPFGTLADVRGASVKIH